MNNKGFIALYLLIPLLIIIVGGVGAATFLKVRSREVPNAASVTTGLNADEAKAVEDKLAKATNESSESKPEPPKTSTSTTQSSTANKPAPTTPTPATSAPAPTPITVDPNSCLPSNAGQYTPINKSWTNSDYLNRNMMLESDSRKKFHDAIVLAGLQSVISEPKVVVFAPNDYVYNSLSTNQKSFIMASSSNARSVVGWHIIKSCVIYKNNMENVKSGQSVVLNTLNGPVTYAGAGLGTIGATSVYMWDIMFTANGTIHNSGFINPPPQ